MERGGLVAADWRKRFPHDATPYTTTSVFLVRKGNPKGIKDWDDLAKPGMPGHRPEPQDLGQRPLHLSGRLGLCPGEGQQRGRRARFRRPSSSPTCRCSTAAAAARPRPSRSATSAMRSSRSRTRRSPSRAELGTDKFDIVYPSISIEAAAPVAIVDKVVDKKGTRKVAAAYLDFLFSPRARRSSPNTISARATRRCCAKFANRFPAIKTFDCRGRRSAAGPTVQKKHFADGGIYDQIVVKS